MSTALSPTSPPLVHPSTWHSPIPYLFGGLAAMLGLIAFALLILACSYWKLSGYLENNENNDANRDLELGDVKSEEKQKIPYEEKFLVIMAGQALPTFLATPVTSRATSFGSNSSNCDCNTGKSSEKTEGNEKEESDDQVQTSSTESPEAANSTVP